MNRILLTVTTLLHLGATWSQHTHWMATSVFDIQVINFQKDLITANLSLEDTVALFLNTKLTGVSGEIEFNEGVTDDYEVRIWI